MGGHLLVMGAARGRPGRELAARRLGPPRSASRRRLKIKERRGFSWRRRLFRGADAPRVAPEGRFEPGTGKSL
jgi:hypothetical protein